MSERFFGIAIIQLSNSSSSSQKLKQSEIDKNRIIYLKSSTSACFDAVASEDPSITTIFWFSKNMHSKVAFRESLHLIDYRSWERGNLHGRRHRSWFLHQARGESSFQFGSNSELGGALKISKKSFEHKFFANFRNFTVFWNNYDSCFGHLAQNNRNGL